VLCCTLDVVTQTLTHTHHHTPPSPSPHSLTQPPTFLFHKMQHVVFNLFYAWSYFIYSALKGRDIAMHPKVWYPSILRSCGVHYINIWGIADQSTWASPYETPCVSNLVCRIFIILMDVIQGQIHYSMICLFHLVEDWCMFHTCCYPLHQILPKGEVLWKQVFSVVERN